MTEEETKSDYYRKIAEDLILEKTGVQFDDGRSCAAYMNHYDQERRKREEFEKEYGPFVGIGWM